MTLKFTWRIKREENSGEKKINYGRISPVLFQSSYKDMVIKTMWYLYKEKPRSIKQTSPNINLTIQMTKNALQINEEEKD